MNEFPADAGTIKRVRAFTPAIGNGSIADGVRPEANASGLRLLAP